MPFLEVTGISKEFSGTKVLENLSFTLERGQVLSIIGPSGSGKTTLLRCLNFLESPDTGTIVLDGEVLLDTQKEPEQKEQDLRSKRTHFGMVFQAFELFPQYTALQNVFLAKWLLEKKKKSSVRAKILQESRELLAKMGLSERENYYPHQLSGGQQQRVAIARALALHPDILCFDEPTSALDPQKKEEVANLLKELSRQGMTMIVVTHEMSLASQISDYVLLMDTGKIKYQGKADSFSEQ